MKKSLPDAVPSRFRISPLGLSAALATAGALQAALTKSFGIPFRYAYNYAEPVVAAVVLNLPSTPLLYRDLHSEPFLINPYNPLYFYLTQAVVWAAGVGPMPAGRTVSYLAGLAAALFIFLILRSLNVQRSAAVLTAALFAQIPIFQAEWTSMRADMTGLALSLGAVACFLTHEKRGGRSGRYYAVGIALAALAVLTKQNFVSAAGAYFLFLACERRFADAVRLFFFMALAVGIPALAWFFMTDGHYLTNQLMSVKKAFYPELLVRFWGEWLRDHALLAGWTAAAITAVPKRGRPGIVFWYLGLALLSTVTLGKIGADRNYFLESCAAAFLLSGLFLDFVLNGLRTFHRRLQTVLLAGLLVGVALLQIGTGLFANPVAEWRGRPEANPHPLDPVRDLIRAVPGPVLAENMGLLLAAHKPIVYEPYEFAQLTYAGVWDESKILDKLDRKEFDLIVLETNLWRINRSSRFTPAFVQSVRRNYRPAWRVAGQIICIPAGQTAATKLPNSLKVLEPK